MAKKVMIEVGSKEYPCYRTMRAMIDQSREGADLNNFEGVLKSVYTTIRGACLREKVEFPFDFEQFIDAVEPDVMEKFGQLAEELPAGDAGEPADGEKKS